MAQSWGTTAGCGRLEKGTHAREVPLRKAAAAWLGLKRPWLELQLRLLNALLFSTGELAGRTISVALGICVPTPALEPEVSPPNVPGEVEARDGLGFSLVPELLPAGAAQKSPRGGCDEAVGASGRPTFCCGAGSAAIAAMRIPSGTPTGGYIA
mmetsp:Transcript_44652/g.138422  ORF Transcript_44652/g.138422 Transcript_44652/m.138422 type:complete len:154 (-) Transcript_44652:8-469(-)